jgi:hypothetical protein
MSQDDQIQELKAVLQWIIERIEFEAEKSRSRQKPDWKKAAHTSPWRRRMRLFQLWRSGKKSAANPANRLSFYPEFFC